MATLAGAKAREAAAREDVAHAERALIATLDGSAGECYVAPGALGPEAA
jgi:hypothetical protein